MPRHLHKNADRGHVQHDWLKTAHSFSFARYVNDARTHFGALLVVNEDVIDPGKGFGKHYHDNMEIVTIPLSGALKHEDSMGNTSIIQAGDVQIMSAGTGVVHSEFNASATEPVHLLQIWIVPNRQGLPTRYEELTLGKLPNNAFRTIIAPEKLEGTLMIHQDSWFSLGAFENGQKLTIPVKDKNHGVFIFIINGRAQIDNDILETGDSLEIIDAGVLRGTVLTKANILVIEVPF